MRLLLAEDDQALRSVLERGLRENGYVVDAVERGDDALHLLGMYDYALAILDWRMPGRPGLEVIAEARRRGLPTPILMLTARDTLADRVAGLDTGADDYLVKPFEFTELLARLRALQRRPAACIEPNLAAGGLEYDPGTREATIGGRRLSLTPTERAILELLLRRRPAVVTRAAIAEHGWHDESEPLGSNTIEVHVARLRAKLAQAAVRVTTVRGVGYRLVTADPAQTARGSAAARGSAEDG
jgi:DNA-binding response OmpR family regulator